MDFTGLYRRFNSALNTVLTTIFNPIVSLKIKLVSILFIKVKSFVYISVELEGASSESTSSSTTVGCQGTLSSQANSMFSVQKAKRIEQNNSKETSLP